MRFTVLGSGTALPDPHRGPAGFAVTHRGRTWLVDGGSGTLQRAARAGIDLTAAAGGIYSHRHPDHSGDLVPLLFAMRVAQRDTDYPIHGGAGLAAFVAGLRQVYGKWITPGKASLVVHELPLEGTHTVALDEGLSLTVAPAVHKASALHLAFDADGKRVVFSGDTGPSEALVELSRGADLLVCECATSDAQPMVDHMNPSAILDLVNRARPKEVWLTHFYPHVDPAAAVATVAASGVLVWRVSDGESWTTGPEGPETAG